MSHSLQAAVKPPPRPTRTLRRRYAHEVVESLADLFPAGRYPATDLQGRACHFDVFVTFERRGKLSVPCSVQLLIDGVEFVLDDGADEFARIHMAGVPTFDQNGSVLISAVRRNVGGRRRGCSLWISHDLSMIAVDDEVRILGD
jgi:hypothetical protein